MEFDSDEIVKVGATNINCLKVLPAQKQVLLQKFAIGDENGQLNVYKYEKLQLQNILQINRPKAISGVQIQDQKTENILFSSANIVSSLNSKGKLYEMDTNSTEPIKSFGVLKNQLFTIQDYKMNQFDITDDSIVDEGCVMIKNKINDIYVTSFSQDSINPVLALKSNSIKVFDQNKELYSLQTDASVLSLTPFQYQQSDGPQNKMLFGLGDGSLIHLDLQKEQGVLLTDIQAQNQGGFSQAGVVSLHGCDFYQKGINDLMLARDDGSIEIHKFNVNEELEIKYKKNLNEKVTAIQSGKIQYPEMQEYLVSTYSGKVISFHEPDNTQDSSQQQLNMNLKISNLKNEITKLKIVQDSQKNNQPTKKSLIVQDFKVDGKIIRNNTQQTHSIRIDCEFPIQMIAVNSNVQVLHFQTNQAIQFFCFHLASVKQIKQGHPYIFLYNQKEIFFEYSLKYFLFYKFYNIDYLKIQLLDHQQHVAKLCHSSSQSNKNLVFTYQMNESDIQKFDINFRTLEGNQGNIQCFIIPQKSVSCKTLNFNIKPLSHHEIVLEPIDETNKHLNILNIKGDFSKNDMHTWISNLLDDFPIISDENLTICYKNLVIGTYLFISYDFNLAVFKSDSVSTITIVKDFISNQAGSRGINLDIDLKTNEQTIKHVLELIQDKYLEQLRINKQIQLIAPLKELQNQEGNINFMADDLQDIIIRADEIQIIHKQNPNRLQFLQGIITDLFMDYADFNGISNQNKKVGLLKQKIQNQFDIEEIYYLFVDQ